MGNLRTVLANLRKELEDVLDRKSEMLQPSNPMRMCTGWTYENLKQNLKTA